MKELKGIDDVIDRVQGLLMAEDEEFSKVRKLIKLYAEEIGYRIIHIINNNPIPKSLQPLWASMTRDMFIVSMPNNTIVLDLIEITGSGMKVGDTSINGPGASSNVGNAGSKSKEKILEEIVFNYKADLYRHRTMRW